MTVVDEIRNAARRLRRAPAYAAFTLLCSTLGIGATAAVFAVVDPYLLRPLPFEAPDRLLSMWKTFSTEQAAGLHYFLKPKDFAFAREHVRQARLAAFLPIDVDVLGEGEAERVTSAKVSGGFFALLGVRPVAGRLLVDDDERLESAVAVVGGAWARRRFGAPEQALGRTLRIDGRPCELVGVVADAMAYPDDTDVWVPLTATEHAGTLGFSVVARLGTGVAVEAAREEIQELGRRLHEVEPRLNANAGFDAADLQTTLTDGLRPSLLALAGAGLGLLLIAGANVACLGLARARRREREVALKTTLGAGRLRLVGEALAEGALLASVSLALGLVLATILLPPMVAASPIDTLSFAPPRVGLRVVLLALAAATVTSLAATLLPALRWALADPRAVVRGVASSVGRSTPTRRAMSVLVIADVAVTTLLLIGAGLLVRTAHRLTDVAPGFAADGIVAFGITAPPGWAEEHPKRVAFFDRLLEEARSLPGVEKAVAVHALPMTTPEYHWVFNAQDRPPASPDATEMVLFRAVTAGYFEALGMPLLEGRAFEPRDGADAPGAVVVNRALAASLWPEGSAVGRRVKGGAYASDGPWSEIVGVVGNVHEEGLAQPAPPALYFPLPQWRREYTRTMRVVLRRAPDAVDPLPALRARLRVWAPDAVVFEVEPLEAIVARSTRPQRFLMVLLVLAAGLALVQATAGLYGVMAYDVDSQVREIGVRIALGASPAKVRRGVLAGAAWRGGIGLLVGAVAAALSGRLLATLLAGLDPADPWTYLAVAAVTASTVLLATYLPARRAAGLDPTQALRRD